MQILSPSEATQARESLGMSQAHVARAVGLNRSYLSQFEGGKRVLEDRWQTALREYFSGEGWESAQVIKMPPGSTKSLPAASPFATIDGFVIAAHIEPDEAEALLEEYYIAGDLMELMADTNLELGFFGEISLKSAFWQSGQYIALAVRQLQIIRILRGQEAASTTPITKEGQLKTLGHVYGYIAFLGGNIDNSITQSS
ncbi:helix-turn-helix domain-containing protein [Parahaliea mediterranea]|uniref:Helix-turn-helix transcriptional regulator n=1 Tax=Parahaliea mediterranea TaxID=651086 RepID=A0A939DI39_9GAMM|nr:helix-turn-helix transcriptional regulator [Parahaliea mediterranea]MBN7798433.1 helix-turn-helix transcriptional regulator [Parahaliea mediterranea]